MTVKTSKYGEITASNSTLNVLVSMFYEHADYNRQHGWVYSAKSDSLTATEIYDALDAAGHYDNVK